MFGDVTALGPVASPTVTRSTSPTLSYVAPTISYAAPTPTATRSTSPTVSYAPPVSAPIVGTTAPSVLVATAMAPSPTRMPAPQTAPVSSAVPPLTSGSKIALPLTPKVQVVPPPDKATGPIPQGLLVTHTALPEFHPPGPEVAEVKWGITQDACESSGGAWEPPSTTTGQEGLIIPIKSKCTYASAGAATDHTVRNLLIGGAAVVGVGALVYFMTKKKG